MSNYSRFTLLLLLAMILDYAGAAPRWVEHASIPGPDTPETGQSRFDDLFLLGSGRYQIPYPFSNLVESLESRIDNAGKPGVRLTFIPMGRSLQRDAPAPDYFKFSRAVIALEGEPVTAGNAAGEVLEYRLFIAHQPKTETLEIISYNDAVGRFEFQVIEKYGPNLSPQVRRANRIMCLSCHQNAAPIFAMRPWSETSFNVEIANKLVSAQPQKYDSLIDVVSADAGVIDLLTERANYLAAAQFIWQRGCQTRRCRVALLRAILQYRLSGESSFDSNHPDYRQDYFNELTRNWETRWPEGLALANSRVADRDPFATGPASLEQDPLFLRPAHATWYRVDPILARGIVYRLSGYLTLADVQRIDRHMIELSDDPSTPIQKFSASCRFEDQANQTRILNCGNATTPESLQARFSIEYQQGNLDSIRIMKLQIPLDANLMQPKIRQLSRLQRGVKAELEHETTNLAQRLANGDRIKSLVLLGNDPLLSGKISLEVEVAEEFRLVDQALSSLLEKNQQALGDSAFRRKTIVRELALALGMKPMDWREPPVAVSDIKETLSSNLGGELALLEPYCSHCHADTSVNPPGFLTGNEAGAKILQCAPRMLARLKAWQAETDFPASPMPPPAFLEFVGTTIEAWPKSAHYRRLVASLENMVRKNHQLLGTDYQHLPPCLARANE
jgi:hypothetical protein